MLHKLLRRRAILLALSLLPCLTAGCASTPVDQAARAADSAGSPPPPPAPWTRRFFEPALLVADEVRIEGPPGLFDHFAVRVEPSFHDRHEETTTDGYLQVVTVRSGAPAEIRGYLDQLELAAMRRVTVLERPGEVPVSVQAVGDVYYAEPGSGREERRPDLRLVGLRPAEPSAAPPR